MDARHKWVKTDACISFVQFYYHQKLLSFDTERNQ